MSVSQTLSFCCLLVSLAATASAQGTNSSKAVADAAPALTLNWPQFRGPGSLGVALGNSLPDKWSATENVAWTAEIPGLGWSSPVIWNGKVFLTTAVNTGKSEAPKKGLYFGGERSAPPESEHEWKVLCFDLATGKPLWERTAHKGKPQTPIHIKNSYASETPVTDGERLYVLFGNVGLFCYDLNGEPVWSKEIGAERTRLDWGPASSPATHAGRFYVVNDNQDDSYLTALDGSTGKELWKVKREERSNWATPLVWHNDKRTEIVTAGTARIRSYDLEGQELWSLKGMSSITIATPYAVDGLLYVSSGYVLDPFRPVYAIKPGATGDISLKDKQTSNEFIAWSNRAAGPYNPTTLVYQGRLYVLYDQGLLEVYDAQTGKPVIPRKRLPKTRGFTASPWAYNDRVFLINEDGLTLVLKAGDKFELLHTNELRDDDMTLATPAAADNCLVIRTAVRLYCIRAAK